MIDTFGKNKCGKTAKTYNILGLKNFKIKEKNLIVGINGSGKTRLLNLIRDLCIDKKYLPVYMDFSQLGNKFQKSDATLSGKNNKEAFTWALLYKHVDNIQDGYEDFVKFTNSNINPLITFINKSANFAFAQQRFQEINSLLKDILGREIVTANKKFYITDRNLEKHIEMSRAIDEMSPGERSIFFFVLQLFIIEELKTEYVVLIDEPESHLHPIALTKLIKFINQHLHPRFSVICSHSVFLLPLFEFEEIKMMDNGRIKKPTSKLYNDIYSDLIGFDNNDENSIYKFLTSIYEWNYSSFLSECFLRPSEVSTGKRTDPQFMKLHKIISRYNYKNIVRVLDYGAGSGRMGKCFELENKEDPTSSTWSKLRYSIYDKYVEKDDFSFKECSWFDKKLTTSDIESKKEKFDIVVLYNVLHEVPVLEWKELLTSICDLLSDDGCLLFGERRVLSKGENPYGVSGYLILEEKELKVLFSTSKIETITIDEIDNDPTVCYVVKKSDIGKITNTEVRESINKLKIRVDDTVTNITRSGRKDRKYAFYCQEYFNCKNAIEELTVE